MKVTITKEDYENSTKDFDDIFNCPLATALKRVFDTDEVFVCNTAATVDGTNDYNISPAFDENCFNALRLHGRSKTVTVTPMQ